MLRDLRYRLEYLLLRLIIGLVRLPPLDVSAEISARIWAFVAPRNRRHQRALANLAIAFPEKSDAERDRIARAMWGNLGRVMAETMQIDRILREPDRLEILNEPMFNRYKDKMGPALGVSLHMGNWELAIWPMTSSGKNPAAIFRSVKNPYVDKYLRDARQNLYPGGLLGKGHDLEESAATARIITDYVRRGGRLGIICDLHDNRGIEVPFFGKPAKSVAIPAIIARRQGVRLWAARCVRVGKQSRFKIEIKELKVPRTGNQADDVRTITAAMQAQFEAWVRENPEQWMWGNRRWS